MSLSTLTERAKFVQPFTMALYGSTNTGKTNFVLSLLKNLALLVDKKMRTIIYCYGSTWQSPIFDEMGSMGVLMHKGLPEKIEDLLQDRPTPAIMIFDDLETDIEKSSMMADCVKKNSHHMDVSIIILYQSLFPLGKRAGQIRQNINVMVFFKFSMEIRSLKLRFSGFVPTDRMMDFVNHIYKPWVSREGGFVVVDKHPKQKKELEYQCIRTNIFPNEGYKYRFCELVGITPPPPATSRKFVRKSGPDTSRNQKRFHRPIRDPRLRRLYKGYADDIYMENWKEPHTQREHVHKKIPVNNFERMYLRHVHRRGKR